MQALMVVPRGAENTLTLNVAGVPLLVRVIATAMRAGVKELALFWPGDTDKEIWNQVKVSPALGGLHTSQIQSFPFNPQQNESWAAMSTVLNDEFLWLPWNFVTSSRILGRIEPSSVLPLIWEKPILLSKKLIAGGLRFGVASGSDVEGIPIRSRHDIPSAERFLVRHSGKLTDGFYSTLNRTLCRPIVRALTHTRVTPNVVTLAGLFVAVMSALTYARGTYSAYVGGAVLFFVSGLIDEMDGMLARLTFRESAFGTWFEGFVDNSTYLLLFAGITAGLYRQHGKNELIWGIALIAGYALSVLVVALQRKGLTSPGRPHEYAGRMNRLMETDERDLACCPSDSHLY
ncbi:MAG TPA: CDP-alcohol phosphatidyltransferase family protein [Bryobacteraceae bacterium]|jgi:phosphatidylglycerophosphate synthase|nr:CDP-alcohol phosphatidyltransferase family protein [Bryobacteraceae bacterium]